jgi:hypothetical protein
VADGVDVPVDSRKAFGEDAGELVRKLVDPVSKSRSREESDLDCRALARGLTRRAGLTCRAQAV